MQIVFDIPTEHTQRVVDALNGIHQMPQVEDEYGALIDEYTPEQWAKEVIRRIIKQKVRTWEEQEATRSAKIAVVVEDDIIS